jgi:hypothetical protein
MQSRSSTSLRTTRACSAGSSSFQSRSAAEATDAGATRVNFIVRAVRPSTKPTSPSTRVLLTPTTIVSRFKSVAEAARNELFGPVDAVSKSLPELNFCHGWTNYVAGRVQSWCMRRLTPC